MARSILITYATKHGSTRQVAEVIAGTLDEQGLGVHVAPAADVHDLSTYDGVVLGTALYMGRPHADARRFLKRYHKALNAIPVAVFAMGPLTTGTDDVAGSKKQLDRALATVSDLVPISTAIFGGVVDPAKLRFPFSHMDASDARDWDIIAAWAHELAAAFGARELVGSAG